MCIYIYIYTLLYGEMDPLLDKAMCYIANLQPEATHHNRSVQHHSDSQLGPCLKHDWHGDY